MTATRRLRVAYHDPEPAPVLRAGVRPLLAELAGAGVPAFWTRHWRRGPHLRVIVDAPDPQWDQLVRPAAQRHLAPALAAHPSTATLQAGPLLATHQALAAREQERGPLEPLQPDNTIEEEAHDPRLHVLGTWDAVALFEGFLQHTNEPALAVAVGEGPPRAAHAVDLMLRVAHELGEHVQRGFLSYRSHAEGYLMGCPDPVGMRRQFQERSAAVRESLVRRVQAISAGEAATDPASDLVLDQLRQATQRAEPLLADGRLDLNPAGGGDNPAGGDAGWAAAETATGTSEFHRIIGSSEAYQQALREDMWFLRYRVALNLLYLHLARTGVRPVERFLYCHAVADAVEEACQVDAVALVAEGAAKLGGQPQ